MHSTASNQKAKFRYNASLPRLLRTGQTICPASQLDPISNKRSIQLECYIFRKYYGNKITKLNYPDKPSFYCPPNQYRAHKSFSSSTLNPYKQLPKYTRKLKVLYNNSDFSQRKERKENKLLSSTISKHKHLTSFEMIRHKPNSSIKLTPLNKSIRTLNNLQNLTLSILEHFLIQEANTILSIKSLKNISITVMPLTKYDKENLKFLQFYISLINMKNLEFLELDFLKSAHKSSNFAEQILSELCQVGVPSYNIMLITTCYRPESVLRIDNIASKVDLITFRSYNTPSVSCTCNTINSKGLLKKKIHLDIIVPSLEELEQFKNSNSSFGLGIKNEDCKTKGYQLRHSLKRLFDTPIQEPLQILPRIKDITRLRSLSVNFEGAQRNKLQSIIEALIEILRNESALENLGLHSIMLLKKSKLELDLYKTLFNEISQLSSLQSLEIQKIEFDYDLVDRVTRPLSSLTNLRKIHLDMQALDPPTSGIDFDIMFPEPSKLVELDIKLIPMTLESQMNFIEAISKLECLQKLNFLEGEGLILEDQCRVMFIEALLGLKKLREIMMIEKKPSSKDKPKKIYKYDVNQVKKIIRDLMGYAEKAFERNPQIEKIYFMKRMLYNVEYEKY